MYVPRRPPPKVVWEAFAKAVLDGKLDCDRLSNEALRRLCYWASELGPDRAPSFNEMREFLGVSAVGSITKITEEMLREAGDVLAGYIQVDERVSEVGPGTVEPLVSARQGEERVVARQKTAVRILEDEAAKHLREALESALGPASWFAQLVSEVGKGTILIWLMSGDVASVEDAVRRLSEAEKNPKRLAEKIVSDLARMADAARGVQPCSEVIEQYRRDLLGCEKALEQVLAEYEQTAALASAATKQLGELRQMLATLAAGGNRTAMLLLSIMAGGSKKRVESRGGAHPAGAGEEVPGEEAGAAEEAGGG